FSRWAIGVRASCYSRPLERRTRCAHRGARGLRGGRQEGSLLLRRTPLSPGLALPSPAQTLAWRIVRSPFPHASNPPSKSDASATREPEPLRGRDMERESKPIPQRTAGGLMLSLILVLLIAMGFIVLRSTRKTGLLASDSSDRRDTRAGAAALHGYQ